MNSSEISNDDDDFPEMKQLAELFDTNWTNKK